MAYTPPAYTPSGSLFGATPATTPYTYGNLGLTSSDYSLWGSKGNPYLVAGPTYTPGSGRPINPQPLTPIAPPSNGGGDSSPIPDWVDPRSGTDSDSNTGFRDPFNDTPFNSKVFGQLYPGLGLAAGVVHGRVDAPFGEGYARLPWYEGSAGNGYGYTEEGYDQFAPGDSDRGIYANYYDANGNLVSERSWDDGFDAYNTNDRWAQTGFFEGMGNIFGGRTWDGLESPTVFGQVAPVASTPTLFGNPNSVEAIEARENIATGTTKAERAVAAAQAAQAAAQAQAQAAQAAMNVAAAEAARTAAENPAQAARDAAYVGTASDGYAATAKRYGTTPGSEQTAMLAEQDMGMSAPATVAEAVAEGKPFGKEGDDSWSPNGKDVYHGPGHNWNTPDSENKAPPGKVTPPPSSNDGGSSDEAGSASNSNMADAGFSQEDQDFIDSGFDEEDSGGGDSGGGGGGGSYIATAATNALGKEGLDMFEGWRDYMHTAHPTFTTSYGRYRVTAPKIVSAIDKKENSKELYQDIWNEYLKPIFNLIKKDMDNPKALSDYKVMVKELMNKYLKGDK